MKPWAQVHASPDFHTAPAPVKAEVRAHYKKRIAAKPEFAALHPDEQARVLKAIDGDGGFAIQMAAVLVAAAQKEKLGRSILEPTYDEALDEALKSAKAAEHYLDVPLKDRPREPFQDEIPGHLDKPLRALLGFVDDALPEYVAYKFWTAHAGQSLEDRLRNVLAASSKYPPRPVDANAALNLAGFIRDYAALSRRLSTLLPPLRTWPSARQEQALTTDAEAALKHGLPQARWAAADRTVQTVLVHVLAGVKDGVPHAFRPDAVPPVVASVKQKAYEMLARAYYRLPSPAERVPLDAEAVGEIILAAAALAPGMEQVADDFPALFAVAAGLAAVPPQALGRFRTFVQNEARANITPEWLLRAVTTGAFSFIKLARLDELLFAEAAAAAGARPEAVAHLTRDAVTAAAQPLLAALVTRSAALDVSAFKAKQAEVRAKVSAEAQRKMAQPAPRPAAPPEEDVPDEVHRVYEVAPAAPLSYEDPDPVTPNEVPAADPAPARPPTAAPAPAPAAPVGPLRAFLRAQPISVKAVKKIGLLDAFRAYADVLAPTGADLDATIKALVDAQLLPAAADHNDLLDALDNESRGAATPPPGAEAGLSAPAGPPASPLETKAPAPATPPAKNDTKAPTDGTKGPSAETVDFTVKVVEVDPAAIIPRKTAAEIEPARVRGVQQRFPEGREYPAVTAYEAKDGLHLIDGHHRTMVAKGRGDAVKAVVVSEAAFKALEAAGVGYEEISYRMLEKAGQGDALTHLRKQYPDKKFPHAAQGAA